MPAGTVNGIVVSSMMIGCCCMRISWCEFKEVMSHAQNFHEGWAYVYAVCMC